MLGTDEWWREVLSYVPGHTPDRASLEAATEQRELAGAGRLLRRYHEAARSFELPVEISWSYPQLPGARTLVCHNDVSPMNTVLRGGPPVAFLDQDPSPAPPAWDLARAARQFAPLSRDAGCARDGWSSPPDRACRLRILRDGYGLSDQDRRGFCRGWWPAARRPRRRA